MGQELRMKILVDFRSIKRPCVWTTRGPHRNEKGAEKRINTFTKYIYYEKKCCNVTTFNDDVQIHFVAGRTIVMTGLALIVATVRGLYFCNDDTGS